MMTTHVKTALPSFSIFRKRRRSQEDSDLALSSTENGFDEFASVRQTEPLLTKGDSSTKTTSPCRGITRDNAEDCPAIPGMAIDLQMHAPNIPKDLGTSCPHLASTSGTLFASDPNYLGITASQCVDFQITTTNGFAFSGNDQQEKAVESFQNSQLDFDTSDAFLPLTGKEPISAPRLNCADLPDFGFQYLPQSALSFHANTSQYFQFPTASTDGAAWPAHQNMPPEFTQASLGLPAQIRLMETSVGQAEIPSTLSGYGDITFENSELDSSCSPTPYLHTLCTANEASYTTYLHSHGGQMTEAESFQGFGMYMTGNSQVENYADISDQLSYKYGKLNDEFNIASPSSEQVIGSSPMSAESKRCELRDPPDPAKDNEEIRVPTAFVKGNATEGYDVSNRCDKEGEETETEEDLDDGDECAGEDGQSGSGRRGNCKVQSYIALISKAILDSPEKRLPISDIYTHIRKHNAGISTSQKSWQNTVRHNLSLNECFVKQVRQGKGRGHYWMVHPACVKDFLKGNYRRRQARRRAKKCPLMAREANFITGKMSEQTPGSTLPLDNVSVSLSLNAGREMWDANSHLIPTSMGAGQGSASSGPETEQNFQMYGQLGTDGLDGGPTPAGARIAFDQGFAGGEALPGTEWFEFPGSW